MEIDALAVPSKYDLIAGKESSQEWKKAEKKRGFGYTSNSQQTKLRETQSYATTVSGVDSPIPRLCVKSLVPYFMHAVDCASCLCLKISCAVHL